MTLAQTYRALQTLASSFQRSTEELLTFSGSERVCEVEAGGPSTDPTANFWG